MSEPTTTTTQRMTVEQATDHLVACLFAGSTPPRSMTALEAIRHHCVHDCMGGDRRAVEEVPAASLPLRTPGHDLSSSAHPGHPVLLPLPLHGRRCRGRGRV